jgi:hypothetical protein
MLNVDQYSYIRTAHRVYGKKIKQIARETGHSKNTIKKVLRGEYSGYKPRVVQPYPILGPYHAKKLSIRPPTSSYIQILIKNLCRKRFFNYTDYDSVYICVYKKNSPTLI